MNDPFNRDHAATTHRMPTPPSAEQVTKARIHTARHATDRGDLELLLDMLGIGPDTTAEAEA